MSKINTLKIVSAVIALFFLALSGIQFYQHRHYQMPVVAGEGVAGVEMLSAYCKSLEGTIADTHIFTLKGEKPGGKILLIGNTHSNEPAALLTALIFIEQAKILQGTVYVIPQFNNSGSRNTKPGDGYPLFFYIDTTWGKKKFRMGNRNASPLDQWPDPDVYVHYPDRQLLSYLDVRNTNRTWPGRPAGPLMERVTYATMELIRREGIDIVVDIHGAETMFPVTNCIVTPDKGNKIATKAALYAKAMEKFENHVEPSPRGFRGLSHREIGDFSEAIPFLLEAPIPFLDQPTGPKTEQLLLDGKDEFLLKLSKEGKLFVPYDEHGWPMKNRVGQHCSIIQQILKHFSKANRDRAIKLKGVPKYADLLKNDVGYYFTDPARAEKSRVYYN